MNRSNIDACIESKDSVALCNAFPVITPENVEEYTEMAKYTLESLRARSDDDDHAEMLIIFYGDLATDVTDYFGEYVNKKAAKKAFREGRLCTLLDEEDRP